MFPSSSPKEYSCILVDDDSWALLDIKNTLPLQEMGFVLIGEYHSAEAAQAAVVALQPALIISDICLGGMSGLELMENCRKLGYAGELIVISGYSSFEYARKAIQTDVSTYLLKPIDYMEGKAALQKVRNKLDGRPQSYGGRQQHIINQIRDYIRDNYQKKLSLDDVADAFHINRTYLSELFRERFGKNFVQYKNEVRIEHAKMLLRDTRLSVSQIAVQCGFDNISYFAMVFKQITGQSPGQFRK